MAKNTQPLFAGAVEIGFSTISAANTAKDGTGTVSTIFTAGSNGAPSGFLRFFPLGTNVVTVGRVFVNNGSTNATATNNSLIGNTTLPATTNSEVAGLPYVDIAIPPLKAEHKINITLGTAVAAGFAVTYFGGDFTVN